MSESARDTARQPRQPYSPHVRTALIFTGTGTAGAYHAGVLRAFSEAGIKIDIVAGRGVGVVSAVFAAIDGGARLWDAGGFWRSAAVSRLYPWRRALRGVGWTIGAALATVLLPLLLLAVGLVVFPIAYLLRLMHLAAGGAAASGYAALVARAFEPDSLPTLLPRAVLVIMAVLLVQVAGAVWLSGRRTRARRRERGRLWWRLLAAPLSAREASEWTDLQLWRLMTGGARLKRPRANDLSRRYAELLLENLGQPGFRELVITVHDLDARRDLVGALVAERVRRDFLRGRRGQPDSGERRAAEVIDFAAVGRAHVLDMVHAALALPVVTDPPLVRFAPESYWRGETHRLGDRTDGVSRLFEEVRTAGADQVIVVASCGEMGAPHSLGDRRLDGRERLGEYLASAEAAAVRDAVRAWRQAFQSVFEIRPAHNPIGPFDFAGAYDERSDRREPLSELIDRGYEDAYRQFIEPVVAAGGEQMESAT